MARRKDNVFVNVPFDDEYEPLFIALIAVLTAFDLTPRTVLEIPEQADRLERLQEIVRACVASVHDLSRVASSGSPPAPRFNMPFELGLTIGAHDGGPKHKWVVLEEVPHRVIRSLSDLNGYDVQIHHGTPEGILRCVRSAFGSKRPLVEHGDLVTLWTALAAEAGPIRERTASVFTAVAFRELADRGRTLAREHLAGVVERTREPLPPIDDDDVWFALFHGIACANGAQVSDEVIAEAVEARHAGIGSRSGDVLERIGAPYLDIASLYFADVNNDGRPEYVLCDTNSVGLHNNRIAGVYGPHNATVYEVPFPARVPFDRARTPTYLADPFLTVTAKGTVLMNFVEESVVSKPRRAAYEWRGRRIRCVERL